MSLRAAARLAWLLCALSLALTVLSLFLLGPNLSRPNTYIYDYWLDNTLGTLSFAPDARGYEVRFRDAVNPVAENKVGSVAF
jgi:hypothetical protein